MFTYYVGSLGGGGYGKSDKRWHENKGVGGIEPLNYVSMFHNFIFKYYHKLDVKHFTTSYYAFWGEFDVSTWGDPLADKCWHGGGGGGKNSQKFADVICEQPLIALFRAKIKMPKFGTKNALLGYFWTEIFENKYCHIWNYLPIFLEAKLCAKIKFLKSRTKNALFGFLISSFE